VAEKTVRYKLDSNEEYCSMSDLKALKDILSILAHLKVFILCLEM